MVRLRKKWGDDIEAPKAKHRRRVLHEGPQPQWGKFPILLLIWARLCHHRRIFLDGVLFLICILFLLICDFVFLAMFLHLVVQTDFCYFLLYLSATLAFKIAGIYCMHMNTRYSVRQFTHCSEIHFCFSALSVHLARKNIPEVFLHTVADPGFANGGGARSSTPENCSILSENGDF